MNISDAFHHVIEGFKDHSGTICAVAAMGGVVVTAYFSGKGAVQVDHLLDPDMTRKERFKVIAKAHWKTAVSGIATCGLIFGSDRIHVRKEVGLAGLAAFWKKRTELVEHEIVERHGQTELDDIRKKIAEAQMDENPCDIDRPLEDGEFIVYEPYTNQYFITTKEKISYALLYANERLQKDWEIMLDPIIVRMGGKSTFLAKQIGWNLENESQNEAWSYYEDGAWLSFREGVTDHISGCPALLYKVHPEDQPPEAMYYREECP